MTTPTELLRQAHDALRQCEFTTPPAQRPIVKDALAAIRAHLAAPALEPVALESIHLTRDTSGMCIVRVNGRIAIRDNGDIIDHMATLEWFAAPAPAVQPVAWKHDCAALCTNDVELWIDACPHCGKPHNTPPAQQPDPWRDAILDQAATHHTDTSGTPAQVLRRIIDAAVAIALDPAVSAEAQALIDRGAVQPVALSDDCSPNHLCNGGRWVHLPQGEQCDRCGHE